MKIADGTDVAGGGVVAASGRPCGAQRDLLGSWPASRVVGATCFASRSTQDALAGRRSASTSGLLGDRTTQPPATRPATFIATSPIVVPHPLAGVRIRHLDVLELVTGDETRPALQTRRPVHVDLQALRVPLIDPGWTDDRALLAGALQAGLGVFDPDVRRPELRLVDGVVPAHRLVRCSKARTCCTPSIGGCNGFGTLPLSSIRVPSGST